jgi:general secretion pathway protein I
MQIALRHLGFTLLEVLIAMAVIALSLSALIYSASAEVNAASRDQQRTLAGYVASNVFAQIRLGERFPEPGERSGRETMGPYQFQWRARVQNTVESDLRRIDLRVLLKRDTAPDEPVLTRTEFLGRN